MCAGTSRGLGECDTAMTSPFSGPQANTALIYPHQTYRPSAERTVLSNAGALLSICQISMVRMHAYVASIFFT